jgi:hypothetical protein
MLKSKYYWTNDETKKLVDLWNQGEHEPANLASQLNRRPEGVRKKLQRLGLLVVGHKAKSSQQTNEEEKTGTKIEFDDLPSLKEAMMLVAGAMNALSKGGLSKIEISRAMSIVRSVKIYERLLANYVRYLEIEAKLDAMEAKFAEQEKMERNGHLKSRYARAKCAYPRLPKIATNGHTLSSAARPVECRRQERLNSNNHARACETTQHG